ncbi:MAG: DUF59 domain-containing protein [Bacteroides sp.]|nr:MAG: DUF59 domain-containing protein [Bacteroides sp.]
MTDLKNKIYTDIVETIKECYDPEIPVNIYDLGLIYNINLTEEFNVEITMTLTSPFCPVAGTLPNDLKNSIIKNVKNINDVKVEVVFDPPWDKEMMSEDAKLILGL